MSLRNAIVLLSAAGCFGAEIFPVSSPLTVHEWGTFTSVAGADGAAIDWLPLSGPEDLPCFVRGDSAFYVKIGLRGKIRMETPVLYFYPRREMSVDVGVSFPQGILTEFYPNATSVSPAEPLRRSWLGDVQGRLEWKQVHLTPGAAERFPQETGKSHYYAARDTDAVPLRVLDQREKFLFYRGVGGFSPPLSARLDAGGGVSVKSSGGVATMVLFERRGGKSGYRILQHAGPENKLDRPALNGDLPSLYRELENILTAEGLTPREAHAMVETWRDSWFEEGARILYIVPRPVIDAVLPLTIDPPPAALARVFVGRMELITPEMEADVLRGIQEKTASPLARYGRILEPLLNRVKENHGELLNGEDAARLLTKVRNELIMNAFGSQKRCQ